MDFRSVKLPPVFSYFSSKCRMSPSKGEYLGQFIIPSCKKIICGLVASGIQEGKVNAPSIQYGPIGKRSKPSALQAENSGSIPDRVTILKTDTAILFIKNI